MAFESLATHDFASAASAKPFSGSAAGFEFTLVYRRDLQLYSIQISAGNPNPVRTAGSKMPAIFSRAKTRLGKG
jgi:hypothetical protein